MAILLYNQFSKNSFEIKSIESCMVVPGYHPLHLGLMKDTQQHKHRALEPKKEIAFT